MLFIIKWKKNASVFSFTFIILNNLLDPIESITQMHFTNIQYLLTKPSINFFYTEIYIFITLQF